jgi:nucleoid DNA-binding protein
VLSKTELAQAVEELTGVKPGLSKSVMDALAQIAEEEISDGYDFSLPGICKISWRYTAPRVKGQMYKKGETYIGFGGVEQTAAVDSKARKAAVRLMATPATAIKRVAPKKLDPKGQSAFLKSKAGKNIVSQKG